MAGIAVSRILELHSHGVHIVGQIPSGLPLPGFPVLTWADWLQAAPAAVGLVLVLFAESMGAARTFASKNGYDVDANQELRALGLANAASAIFHGMQVGGGTSGTAANDANGAQSQVSSIAASADRCPDPALPDRLVLPPAGSHPRRHRHSCRLAPAGFPRGMALPPHFEHRVPLRDW